MAVDDEDVRVAIYAALAGTGRAPSVVELVHLLGSEDGAVRAAVRRLAEAHHLVIGDDDQVVMAHPFSTIPLGFSVMGRSTLWWGGCAWDSFALPHLVPDEPEVLVSTRCPSCGRALAWVVSREEAPVGGEVAHFLVPVARMWDDVIHTCSNQRLFCDEACVDAWVEGVGEAKGYVMDLATLWRFASHWYDGRLDRGYARRDPATAQTVLPRRRPRRPVLGLLSVLPRQRHPPSRGPSASARPRSPRVEWQGTGRSQPPDRPVRDHSAPSAAQVPLATCR